jgi:hypothetical protein
MFDWMQQSELAKKRRGNLAGPLGNTATLAEMQNYPGARTGANRTNLLQDSALAGMDTLQENSKAEPDKIFGLSPDKFSYLAGALGSAIAPDTPMGRVGAVASNYAGQNIERTQTLEDKAADQQTQETTEARRRQHELGMQRTRLESSADEADASRRFQRSLKDLEWERTADDRARAQAQHDLLMQKYQKEIDNPNLSHITNDDGSITFFDRAGKIVRQTEPGIGKTSQVGQNSFVPRETVSQINQTIENATYTLAGLLYDPQTKMWITKEGTPADPQKIQAANNYMYKASPRVKEVMNAKRVDSTTAFEMVKAVDLQKAAEQILAGQDVISVAAQYPIFSIDEIEAMTRELAQKQRRWTGNEDQRLGPRLNEIPEPEKDTAGAKESLFQRGPGQRPSGLGGRETISDYRHRLLKTGPYAPNRLPR